jgi:ATP synthase protein I
MKNDLVRAASLGLEIAAAVFVGAGIGFWVDMQLKCGPWAMAAGLAIGSLAGFWNACKFAEGK